VSHAEAIIDQLAMMHAKFYKSLRFDRDLSWITLYRGRPGQVLAHRTVLLAEKRFFRKYDAPVSVQRLTRFHLENRDAFWRVWDSLPPTLCHGDSHIGNTYENADGTSGLFDWQEMHKMNGMREVAYFIAWAFTPEVRADKEKDLLVRYLDVLASHGVGDETPSLSEAFDLYRLMMIDAWTSVWAPLAIGGMEQPGQAEILLDRMYGMLLDLDVEKALRDAI
jgi:Phosphotransferase enzyme family